MDKLSREMFPLLEYFIVFSSIACARGNAGQTNYGLANSFMERVCERRRRDGLHGLAVQWGFVGDVGFVVENVGTDVQSIRGTTPQRLLSCLTTLDSQLSKLNGFKYDIYALDPQITLGELGMDSLMAIEVQQTMDRNFNVSITPGGVRQMKISELIALLKKFDSNEIVRVEQNFSELDIKEEFQFSPEEPTTMLNNCTGELMLALPPRLPTFAFFELQIL